MAQPIASVDICNLALDRLGQSTIVSVENPTSGIAEICARWYDPTRREMLRRYIFNFARDTVNLAVNANAPTHPDFTNGYSLPNDFIRLLTIGERNVFGGTVPTRFFDFKRGYLYCDDMVAADDAAGLRIGYIFDAKVVQQFDPLFVKVLALQQAVNMCKAITKKKPDDELLAELKDADLAAAAVAGQEKPPQRIQRSRIRDVRRSDGSFRDNTIIGGPGTSF